MIAKVQKWGNSLAIRIPKSFADETKIKADCEVELSIRDNELVIKNISTKKYSLISLMKNVNEKNIHYAVDLGDPEGKEIL